MNPDPIRIFVLTNCNALVWCLIFVLAGGPFGNRLQAQDNAQDNTPPVVLTLDQLLEQVLVAHPIVRQAELLAPMALAEIRSARGAFDPKVDFHVNRKDLWNYKEDWRPTTYYENQDHFLKVPTWVGDVKFGFERYTGINVNPENFTPPQGLAYVQFSVPLARGLLWDERRAVLRQAQLMTDLNDAERAKLINKFLLEVAKDYWNWYESWRNSRIQRQGLNLASERLVFVREQIQLGELALIDSIEAAVEVQKRELTTSETDLELQNSALRLAIHLWTQQGQPAELRDDVQPDLRAPQNRIGASDLENMTDFARSAHPEILKLQVKVAQLDVEERWRKNDLLPSIEFNYKPFFIPGTRDPKIFLEPDYTDPVYLSQNFKVGLNVSMPIFLRKERGKLELVRYKQEQTRLDLDFTRRHVAAELQTAYNDMDTYRRLIRTQQLMVGSLQSLLDAERERLTLGESSLFVINSRERSLISAQVKLVELEAKYFKSMAHLYWASGLPYNRWAP